MNSLVNVIHNLEPLILVIVLMLTGAVLYAYWSKRISIDSEAKVVIGASVCVLVLSLSKLSDTVIGWNPLGVVFQIVGG